MLRIHEDSHTDHGLTQEHIDFILKKFQDRNEFFIESFELPERLPSLTCDLVGPAVGLRPVTENEVVYRKRGDREYTSRLVVNRMERMTRTVTVIAGPHEGFDCVLYTAFGGPQTPKEVNDPALTSEEREDSEAFWAVHALQYKGEV